MRKLFFLLASFIILTFSTVTKIQALSCFWFEGACVSTADPVNFPACNFPQVEGPPSCQEQCNMAAVCDSNSCDQMTVFCVAPTNTPPPGTTPTPTSTIPTPTPILGCVRATTNSCTGIWNCQPLSANPYSCINSGWCCSDPSYCSTLPPEPTPVQNTTLPHCSSDTECQSDFADGSFDLYCDCGLRTGVSNPAYCSNPTSIGALCRPNDGDPNTGVKTPFGCLAFTSGDNNENAAKITISVLSNWSIAIGAGIALFIILFASLQIATGSGDPKRIKAGQELLFSGLAGMFLISMAIVVLNFLGVKILGLDLLGFFI